MKIISKCTLFVALSAALCCSCRQENDGDARKEFKSLISSSDGHMQNHDADAAMEDAVAALELADANHLDECSAEALNTISSIDVFTSRDSHGWEYASKAEEISRKMGFKRELTRALLNKAHICIYAEISADDNRNDEAIVYLEEALPLALEIKDIPLQIDAYYTYGQVYVNKNRWNTELDQKLVNLAETNLTKGETLAASEANVELQVRGLLYRIRLLRQTSKLNEAVEHCQDVLASRPDDDYLTRYQVYDQLTSLEYSLGEFDKVIESHRYTLYYIESYIRQKADEQLQKMETEYETSLKEQTIKKNRYQILSLCLVLLGLCCVAVLLYRNGRQAREANARLEHAGKIKDQLISFLSNDLNNPAETQKNAISEFAKECASLSEQEIKRKSELLVKGMDALNEDVAEYVSNLVIERVRNASSIGLSKRELDIVRLSAKGYSAADIAKELFISIRTVNNHKSNIFSKMDVNSTTEMIARAQKIGLI